MKQELAQPHFGLHLTVDAYGCDEKTLNNRAKSTKFLNTLVAQLGMRKLIEPVVVHAVANDKKDPGGYSGFVMIQESHISIHTFPKRKFISIDLYSCTDFNTRTAQDYIKEFYAAQSLETNTIIRGKRYPMKNIVSPIKAPIKSLMLA